jgi:hypothetical protein
MAVGKWQYHVHRGELSAGALDDIGADGWELVSVIAGETGPTYYFKRQRPSLAEQITLEQRERYVSTQRANTDRS